jgi:NADPH:quinone reductase
MACLDRARRVEEMKAIVLNGFGNVENLNEARLRKPAIRPGEVRVRIKAVSFNPVDCQIRTGRAEGRRLRSMILGRDLSGIVEAVHAGVEDFKAGDEVYGQVCNLASSGTYTEFVSVPAELLARKPASLTHEQAAAIPVAAITAWLALGKARLASTRSLFIAGGAGGVGSFALSLAQCIGVGDIFTTAGSEGSRAYLVGHHGLAEGQVIDYRHEDVTAHALRRNGGPFDVALDFVGGEMLSACCALLAPDGHLVSAADPPSRDEFEMLFDRNATFHSVGTHAFSLAPDRRTWKRYREILDRLSALIESGALRLPRIRVLGNLSPEVVRLAHQLLDSRQVQGKLVMSC